MIREGDIVTARTTCTLSTYKYGKKLGMVSIPTGTSGAVRKKVKAHSMTGTAVVYKYLVKFDCYLVPLWVLYHQLKKSSEGKVI